MCGVLAALVLGVFAVGQWSAFVDAARHSRELSYVPQHLCLHGALTGCMPFALAQHRQFGMCIPRGGVRTQIGGYPPCCTCSLYVAASACSGGCQR